MALIWAGIILFGGSIVQGTIGFALGMIAVPLLVEAGYSLSQAVALTTLAIGIQVAFGVWQLREHIPWDDVKLAALLRYLTVPLGIWLLLQIENMDANAVERLVGCGVLLGVGLRMLARGQKARDLPLSISAAAFALSGILQGLVAMGGPPLVLWMTTRSFDAHQARAFTKTLFLLNAPLQLLLLLLLSQTMNAQVLGTALLLTPLIFAGTTIGVRIGNRLSKARLNAIALALLTLIGLNAIF